MSEGLEALFTPSATVVFGASADERKLGSAMVNALARSGATVLRVNARSADPDQGIYATVADATRATGVTADLAVMCIPAAGVGDALREAAGAGVGAALVCAGGFAEIGVDGDSAQRSLEAAIADTGIRVLGPNTSGFFAPGRISASFVPGVHDIPSGGIAIVASSGGVNHALAFELAGRGEGVSLAVGIGGGSDVTSADVVEYLADDPATTAICLHLETVPDGSRLLNAVRRASRTKPVVALVVGRNNIGEFAQSHTGALATAWRTTRSVLAQAGAVVVDDDRALLDAACALSRVRLAPRAKHGVAVVTGQAGPALLMMDGLQAEGVHLPQLSAHTEAVLGTLLPPMTYLRNPVDTGRPGPTFGQVVSTVAEDEVVDLVAVYALVEPGAIDLAEILGTATPTVPVIVATAGPAGDVADLKSQLDRIHVPVVTSPAAAVTAVRALVVDSLLRYKAEERMAQLEHSLGTALVLDSQGPFDESQAKEVLDQLGIPTPARRTCDDRTQAHQALTDIGAPVVIKILDANITHKTEIGGVIVGVRDHNELDSALDALDAVGARRYLVEHMADGGPELVVGALRDPIFGPVVLLGIGGVGAEVLQDVAVRQAPVTSADVADMLNELQAGALVQGFRGAPAIDQGDLTNVVCGLGQVIATNEAIAEIEINPLRVTPSGVLALDCVILEASSDVR